MHGSQQQFDFGGLERDDRARLVQLCRAVNDCNGSATLKLLVRLVFDMTDGGRREWHADDELIRSHALGPRCSRSTMFETIRTARDLGLLSRSGSALWIDWKSVAAIRGVPVPGEDAVWPQVTRTFSLPERTSGEESQVSMRGGFDVSPKCPPVQNLDSEIRKSDCLVQNLDSAVQKSDCRGWIPCAPIGVSPAPARPLSSCLDLSCLVDDVDKSNQVNEGSVPAIDWPTAWARAAAIARRLMPEKRLDERSRVFLLSVCALAGGQLSEEWLDGAVQAAAVGAKGNPLGYLRRTLVNRLVEYDAVAHDKPQAEALMGRLLLSVRQAVHRVLRQQTTRRESEVAG